MTQKYLIVTSNYPARQKGVAKLMSIKEAQQKCPDLILVNGEDLTPYRYEIADHFAYELHKSYLSSVQTRSFCCLEEHERDEDLPYGLFFRTFGVVCEEFEHFALK